jgi:hypothetical protein
MSPKCNVTYLMTDKDRQELSGRLFANELMITVLLTDLIKRNQDNPNKTSDTEYLEAFVTDLHRSFSAQASKMSPEARAQAERKILQLLGASLSPYWK